MAFLSMRALRGLNFTPSGVSNRITEYALAAVLAPVALVGVALVISGLRWLLMSIWPGRLGIIASADALTFQLGPMGVQRYAMEELTVRYLFESSPGEESETLYEALLDPDVQMAEFLPRIEGRQDSKRLDLWMLKFAGLAERQCAASLRPWTDMVRNDRGCSSPSDTANET